MADIRIVRYQVEPLIVSWHVVSYSDDADVRNVVAGPFASYDEAHSVFEQLTEEAHV